MERVEQKDQKVGKYEWGRSLLESAYEACLFHELRLRGLALERQRPVGLTYKGLVIDCGYRVDVLVDALIVVELKASERLLALHAAQILTYMKLLSVSIGLLVNFNVTSLRQGLRRLSLQPSPPSCSSRSFCRPSRPSARCTLQFGGIEPLSYKLEPYPGSGGFTARPHPCDGLSDVLC